MIKTSFLLLGVLLGLGSQTRAQDVSPQKHPNEFATGALFFWENNLSTVGVGLRHSYQRTLTDRFRLVTALSFVQSIPDWQIDAGYSTQSGLIAEVGAAVSPFAEQGRFEVGVSGAYRYGGEAYEARIVERIDDGRVTRTADLGTNVISQVGYSFSVSYRLPMGERFVARPAVQIYGFNYFGELITPSFQVGYRF